jgi:hypothetical protein
VSVILGSYVRIALVAHIGNWATFINGKSCALIISKMDWATFLATFLQTHLVTLLSTQICRPAASTNGQSCRVARFVSVQLTKTGENIPNDQNIPNN